MPDSIKKTSLVITSIADDKHPVLNHYAVKAIEKELQFILIGDTKSPEHFSIHGCDYYSIDRQLGMNLEIAKHLPNKHYSRKNIGYLLAIQSGSEVIIETDDDNIPMDSFWESRAVFQHARLPQGEGWVNVYKYFSSKHIWPRGFDIEKLNIALPIVGDDLHLVYSPIQQGLADDNPDVDAIFRMIFSGTVKFEPNQSIALSGKLICPFNSQNTTWFKEAFPLMYLPSYCSFRMTDIWRSFIAIRIASIYNWNILFHKSTVRQDRNIHSLIKDFEDEIPGYINNNLIVSSLQNLHLEEGLDHIYDNLEQCYFCLVRLGLIDKREINLVRAWIRDLTSTKSM